MSFKPLTSFIHHKKSKMCNLLKKTDKYNVNNIRDDCPILKGCIAIQALINKHCPTYLNNNLVTLDTTIDYHTKFNQYNKKGSFSFVEKELSCFKYDNSFELEDQYLFYKLAEEMKKGKMICLLMNLTGYLVMEYDDDSKTYLTHSVCGIFIPIAPNKYEFIYFNSHGNNINTYTTYELLLSSKRLKKVKLPMPYDYIINNALIHDLNEYLITYKHNIHVNYETTEAFNYTHVNLQNGDNYGLCFMFPLIIWYNLIYKFKELLSLTITDENNTKKEFILESSHTLFKKKKWEQFMTKIFLPYDKEFGKLVFNLKFTNTEEIAAVDTFIEKRGTIFLKNILNTLLSFLSQRTIKDKLCE